MAIIATPILRLDFDRTEVAVSWKVLTGVGHRVVFATPTGNSAKADQIMLDGSGWTRGAWCRACGGCR